VLHSIRTGIGSGAACGVLALCLHFSTLALAQAGAEGEPEPDAPAAERSAEPEATPEPEPEPFPSSQEPFPDSQVGPEAGVEAELQPEPDPEPAALSEEITVTARRREEGLQSTPVAVSAFSASDLEHRNVDSTDDLALFTPNLELDGAAALSGSSSNATIFIRGIGQNDFAIFSDPGVGLYVDDVYLGRSIGGVFDVVDLQRVEVLRGPQGTLFGRNTIGGAVLLTSRRPSFDPEGYVEITGGRFFRADLRAALNAPLVDDRLAARIAVARLSRDGYAERLVDGAPLGDIDRTAGRVQLMWTPSDEFELLLSADGVRAREHSAPSTLVAVNPGGFPFQNIFNALVAPTAGVTEPSAMIDASFVTGDPYTTYATGPNQSDLDVWGLSLTPTWELTPEVSIKSISAYRRLEAVFGRDGDNTPFTFRETLNDDEQWQLSEELQVFGDSFEDRLSWLVGGYYFREEAEEDANAFLAEGVFGALEALPAAQAFPPGGPPAMVCAMVPPPPGCFGGMGNPNNVGADLVIDLFNGVENQALAGFAHVTVELVAGLSVTGGVRVTHETKTLTLVHQRIASGAYIVPPGSVFDASWTSVDPKAGLEYQPLDNLLAYFTWSRGFKSGGFNARPLVNAMEVTRYDPERAWSYELGLKTDWLRRALVANLAAFYYDYTDIQLTVNETPRNFVANAARASLFGGELELRARPVRPFQIDATVGYLHGQYDEIGEGLTMTQVLPITADSELAKAPDLTLSGGAEYTLELGEDYGALALRADVAYRSKVFHDVGNNPLIAQDGYALLGARLAWMSDEDEWELALFGTNLTDERYRISGNAASPAFGVVESTYGRPREWGATLTRRF
jgi:iron complex outermembrane receptor protein